MRSTSDEQVNGGLEQLSGDAHPSVQNGALRERKTACYWLGPNALLIVLLVSSVRPQRERGESRR